MRQARAALAIPTAALVVLTGCADGSEDETTETSVDVAEVVVDADEETPESEDCGEWCAVTTEEQRALIDRYIAAWNENDVDAMMALAGDGEFAEVGLEEVRCEYEAILSADVALKVDFDSCDTTFTDAAGERTSQMGGCLHEFDVGTVPAGEDPGRVLLHSGIAHQALATGFVNDAVAEAFWECRECAGCDEFHTETQKAVIEDYVEAFNAQDVDAVMALISPQGDSPGPWVTAEEARCRHEAVFRADLTLSVDIDDCSFRFTDATGRVLPPSSNGPCLIGWFPVFAFIDDGAGEQLEGTLIIDDLLEGERIDVETLATVEGCRTEQPDD